MTYFCQRPRKRYPLKPAAGEAILPNTFEPLLQLDTLQAFTFIEGAFFEYLER